MQQRDDLSRDLHDTGSRAICTLLHQWLQEKNVQSLAAFWPFGSEVDLRPLLNIPGLDLWFPKVQSARPPQLIWGQLPLEAGRWGLMEPVEAHHALPPVQVVLVPGLAFDPQGYRLGYGGGFYDALIPALPPQIITLGVGFHVQRSPTLPVDAFDQPVQFLMTEQGLQERYRLEQ